MAPGESRTFSPLVEAGGGGSKVSLSSCSGGRWLASSPRLVGSSQGCRNLGCWVGVEGQGPASLLPTAEEPSAFRTQSKLWVLF